METETRQANTHAGTTRNHQHYRGGLAGPIILIALGVMFLLDQFIPGWGIGKTWPVLLVVIGIVKLVDSTRPPRPPEGPKV